MIELLVVLAIIAILAAIVTFGVITFLSNANTSACQQEKSTVQAAMDAMMASQSLTTVAAGGPISNFSGNGTPGPSPGQSLGDGGFLRNPGTKFSYSWNASGVVSTTSC